MRGLLWFIPRNGALTPGLQALVSFLLGIGGIGRPRGLLACGGKAKLIGRRRCLCQNLIINPPYCEKWISPGLLFLRQRSLVWSGAPSCPHGGFLEVALGVAAALLWWGLPQFLLGFLCSFHHVLDCSLETGRPFPARQLSSPNHPQGLRAGLWSFSPLGGGGNVELPLSSTPPNSSQQGLVIFISLPNFSESGWEQY